MALSVALTVKQNVWLFPVGIVGTVLYILVFARAHLYGSATLQVFFIVVQLYGWWFWTRRGPQGEARPIQRVGLVAAAAGMVGVGLVFAAVGYLIGRFTDAHAPIPDAMILGLSMAAQVLLSRKIMESWPFWLVVDVGSVALYGSQGLLATSALYALFLFMASWGWWEWERAARTERLQAAPL